MRNTQNDTIEIDIKDLYHYLLSKIWIIFVVAICCAAATGIYSQEHQSYTYNASASIYIVTQTDGKASYGDLEFGSQLINDYMTLATSEKVINDVINELKLNISYGQVVSSVFMNNPKDTRVIYITVSNENSEAALNIVNALVKAITTHAPEIMNVTEPNVIDNGKIVAVYPSVNVNKNEVIGGILGMALSCIILIVLFVQNDTIRTEENLQKYIGLELLATIPISYERSKSKLNSDCRKEARKCNKDLKKEIKEQKIHKNTQVKHNDLKSLPEKKSGNKQTEITEQLELEESEVLEEAATLQQEEDPVDELRKLDIFFSEIDKKKL